MKNKKVRIENANDLINLPARLIKNTKLCDFHGKYFDKIYEEAIKIEREGVVVDNILKINVFITKIIFEINFKTQFGEKIGIAGSIPQLGNWEINKTLNLVWTDGNIWKTDLPFNPLFEFKFVFFENDIKNKWESCQNRIFDFIQLKTLLESNNLNKYNIIIVPGKYKEETIIYDHLNSKLILRCNWQV